MVIPSAVAEKSGILVNGKSQRPVDVYIPTLLNGRDYAVDVTIISHSQSRFQSPLCQASNIGVTLYGVNTKPKKYASSCAEARLVFVPFALDSELRKFDLFTGGIHLEETFTG